MGYKTTKKHFSVFMEEAGFWINFFGLHQWDISFFHDIPIEADSVLACCIADSDAMQCSLMLNPFWSDKPTVENIRAAAFHEVCENLLGKTDSLAKARYVTVDEINSERHSVISILYNSVYRKCRPLLGKS